MGLALSVLQRLTWKGKGTRGRLAAISLSQELHVETQCLAFAELPPLPQPLPPAQHPLDKWLLFEKPQVQPFPDGEYAQ